MARTNSSSDQPKAGTAWSAEGRRCAIAYDKEQQEKLESSKIQINAKGGGRKAILTFPDFPMSFNS